MENRDTEAGRYSEARQNSKNHLRIYRDLEYFQVGNHVHESRLTNPIDPETGCRTFAQIFCHISEFDAATRRWPNTGDSWVDNELGTLKSCMLKVQSQDIVNRGTLRDDIYNQAPRHGFLTEEDWDPQIDRVMLSHDPVVQKRMDESIYLSPGWDD